MALTHSQVCVGSFLNRQVCLWVVLVFLFKRIKYTSLPCFASSLVLLGHSLVRHGLREAER